MQLKSSAIRFALVAAFFAPALLATAQVGGGGGSQEKAVALPIKTIKAGMADLLITEQAPAATEIRYVTNKSRKMNRKSEAVLPKKTTSGK